MNGIAWGAKVSEVFKAKLIEICDELVIDPSWLMSVMAFETGQTFSSSIRNKWTGATGLIQFMPQTARMLGTSCEELSQMEEERQLDYVLKYFRAIGGKFRSLEDLYMAVLWPAAIGKSPEYVLWSAWNKAYASNKGLDRNRDGQVTVAEATSKVRDCLKIGMMEGYIG